jgi:hypothetical protein
VTSVMAKRGGLNGLRVVQVTLAMIASARDGRTVKIEPLAV